ncbi:hypothetical protein [Derxia lacustris]|uniref:hypothetical protein n=1 Tax=Derxia lacustris TaxID=764842 RepID=UPI000A16D402|nr:hypothetical protein [Derxia lacustris]
MATDDLQQLAARLRADALNRVFGAIRFWRFAVVRPHDQAFELLSVAVDGDRLDLELRHASGAGSSSLLSVWAPAGLSIGPAGVAIAAAERLRFDDNEAWLGGADYRIRTPRGEGGFAVAGADALTLET